MTFRLDRGLTVRVSVTCVFENERRPNAEDRASLLKRFSHETLVDKLEKLIMK